MKRFFVLKDGQVVASTADREQAVFIIRQYQEVETHYLLRSSYSIIEGIEELIPYAK